MVRQRNKVAFLSVLCLILLFLCSCSRQAVRITREEALAIQDAIDGILEADADKYRSAFPPDYDEAIKNETELLEQTDFNDYLVNKILLTAQSNGVTNYGKNFNIEYIVYNTVQTLDISNSPQYFADYSDYYVYDYSLDMSKIQKAVTVVGSLNAWGNNETTQQDAAFIMIKIDGKWYLHPMYYFNTFS